MQNVAQLRSARIAPATDISWAKALYPYSTFVSNYLMTDMPQRVPSPISANLNLAKLILGFSGQESPEH